MWDTFKKALIIGFASFVLIWAWKSLKKKDDDIVKLLDRCKDV